MSRNAARPQPQRGVLLQPRATPWVQAPKNFSSPERAAQPPSRSTRNRPPDCPGILFRPFRALISFHVSPRALPWAVMLSPRWGFEWAKLDALVGKVELAVERLQEYRTALITAAVTGKIDVRDRAGSGKK